MPQPLFVTLTGADDATAITDLRALASDYPVEFAILFSPKRSGSPRYPSWDWIETVRASGLRLAAHLCGDYSRELIDNGDLVIEDRLAGFARIQVNTADPAISPPAIRAWTNRLAHRFGHPVAPILQCRGDFPRDDTVGWLFDCSGGCGIEPAAWPRPVPATTAVGYAGGLGPQNVARVLADLSPTRPFWIDMESSLRDAGDRFDLATCREVCERVFARPIAAGSAR